MIGRYTTDAMADVWSEGAKHERWRQVEIAVVRATDMRLADVLQGWVNPVEQEIARREAEVGHDFVAWLQAWTFGLDPEYQRAIHAGLTSSDVVDTALSMAMRDANKLVFEAATNLVDALAFHVDEHGRTIRVARTHGRPAEVSSWGLWAQDAWARAFTARKVFRRLSWPAERCMISGPVGTYAEVGPGTEERVARWLGLQPARTSTQVLERGAVADAAYGLVALLGICERVATEVRLGALHGELEEGRSEEQVGSSAMPQKRNPISSENICGLARLGRGYLSPILESVALWHERDISHSAVERTALPDLYAVTEFALLRTAILLNRLVVHADVMRSNVHRDYVDLLKHWALCRMVGGGADRWEAHQRLQDALTLDELEELTGFQVPEPEWFLRNALDKEASAMV